MTENFLWLFGHATDVMLDCGQPLFSNEEQGSRT
jgi:hypothetical protein